MAIVAGVPAPIQAVAHTSANLSHAMLASTLLVSQQPLVHLAALTPDPYLVSAGQLVADSGYGIAGVSSCYHDSSAQSTGSKLTPLAL